MMFHLYCSEGRSADERKILFILKPNKKWMFTNRRRKSSCAMKTDTQISAPSARAVIVNKSDYVHRRLRRNIKTVSHYEFVLQGDSSTEWHKILLNCPQIRSSTAATATDPLPITSRSSRQYPPPIIRISYIRIFLSIVQLQIPITNSSPRIRFKL